MFLLINYFFFMVLFAFFLGLKVGVMVMAKEALSLKKGSPYECGFNEKSLYRVNFSMQFFMVALLFLIFDVELLLMIPYFHSFFFFFFKSQIYVPFGLYGYYFGRTTLRVKCKNTKLSFLGKMCETWYMMTSLSCQLL